MPSKIVPRLGLKVGLWYVKRRVRIATVDRRSPTLLGRLQWLGAGAGLAFAAGYLIKPKTRAAASSAVSTAAAAVKEKAAEVKPLPDPTTQVELPSGVTLDVEDGIGFLRGEVESAKAIAELVRKVEAVDGVRAVQSLLTLPGSPAPTT